MRPTKVSTIEAHIEAQLPCLHWSKTSPQHDGATSIVSHSCGIKRVICSISVLNYIYQ